ncbi:hypothetical protein FHY55_05070 [Oceanicola sp. D3]|uniref:hypothetical protein n=1 Tax=Oceanicola sp. D3 TaxID=2587163 RepID=UPI00111DB9C9|nr:hypothetical protein [Oceanicola sp. D3]QDC08649.1 hypothetical protein FHY55_05070 [Oceanicola sp. D3]
MRGIAALIVALLSTSGAASASDLRAQLSGKVLYFEGRGEETILFSLNPDGTGIGQETRGGRPRPEAIRWRVKGPRLCIKGKPGGMSASGREECVLVTLRGNRVKLGPKGNGLEGVLTTRKK